MVGVRVLGWGWGWVVGWGWLQGLGCRHSGRGEGLGVSGRTFCMPARSLSSSPMDLERHSSMSCLRRPWSAREASSRTARSETPG